MTKKETRERLASIRGQKTEARTRLAAARTAVTHAKASGDADMIATAEAARDASWDEVEHLAHMENLVLGQAMGDGFAADRLGSLRNNPEAQEALMEIAGSTGPIRNQMNIGQLMGVEEFCGLTGRALQAGNILDAPSSGGASSFLGIAPTPFTPTSLLDFFESVPFTTRTADILRRSGAADAAIQVAGTLKAEASLVYTPASLRAITIAVWSKANRQDLEDIEALLADVGQALNYGTLRKVEDLLLNGAPADGEGDAVPGLLDDPFVATVTATTLDGAVGQMKAQLLATGVVPNFAAANAVTIEEEEARVGTDGHPINAISTDGRIRRLPLVSAEALADGQVIVGDSRISARLGVRSAVGLAVSPSDQDDFIRNRVTILSEGRFTPLVKVPSAIAAHTLA